MKKLYLVVLFNVLAFTLLVEAVSADPKPTTMQGSTSPPGQVGAAPLAPETPVGSGFTYQGLLRSAGNPANGQYDFQFTLYDAASGGNQVGSLVAVSNQAVSNGLFTVQLDFGPSAFQGSARWLEMAVRQTGGGSFTTLSPRQALTASPYALSLMPGATITGTIAASPVLSVTNAGTGGTGMYGSSPTGFGVYGTSSSVGGVGVYGYNPSNIGVYGVGGYAVYGQSDQNGFGVYGNGGYGVTGVSDTGVGLYGSATGSNGAAVYGSATAPNGTAVWGVGNGTGGNFTGGGFGIYASSTTSTGIGIQSVVSSTNASIIGSNSSRLCCGYGGFFHSNTGAAVYAESNGAGVPSVWAQSLGAGSALWANSGPAFGVSGTSINNTGVYGYSQTQIGVYGSSASTSGVGVSGTAQGSNAAGVFGSSNPNYGGYAGYFKGNVHVTGTCCAMGQGTTQIDDPLDPANKYLNQSVVQSPDMKDIYDGVATTGDDGLAVVTMPDYFQALNRDFRYQLTCIGQFAQAIVWSELKDNHFTIKTDKPGVKVSWQVTGIRQDPYANAHPLIVEQAKPAGEQGLYLYPELYGQPDGKGIGNDKVQQAEQSNQQAQQQAKALQQMQQTQQSPVQPAPQAPQLPNPPPAPRVAGHK